MPSQGPASQVRFFRHTANAVEAFATWTIAHLDWMGRLTRTVACSRLTHVGPVVSLGAASDRLGRSSAIRAGDATGLRNTCRSIEAHVTWASANLHCLGFRGFSAAAIVVTGIWKVAHRFAAFASIHSPSSGKA